MERCCLSRYKSSLLIFMILLIIMVGRTQSVCLEDERKALLQIKASLHELPNSFNVDKVLSTWVDQGRTSGDCCGWERIKCDTTSRHVTELSLSNIFSIEYRFYSYTEMLDHPGVIWPLNASLFIHFRELRSLDLSWNYIDSTIMSTGFEKLSSLKKLEVLNLSYNCIETSSVPSFGAFTSLKTLDIGYSKGRPYLILPPFRDIVEFSTLENLELLDITGCGYYGTLRMQDSETNSILRNLKILNLGDNHFNESLISSLSAIPSLKALDLSGNWLSSFPPKELSSLKELTTLNLMLCGLKSITLNGTITMSNLLHLTLDENEFINDDIMRSLAAFPSLKFLSLDNCANLGGRLFANEVPKLPDLEVLILSENSYNGTIPIEALSSFHHLKFLDLSYNNFVGSIPSTIASLSSLEVVSFALNQLNGSLTNFGLCELKNLSQLDLSNNNFNGNLPECFNKLSTLKFFDISTNQFTGTIPPTLIPNLSSLEYVDFSYNKFEGPFSFSSFSNHTKIEFVSFISGNDKFMVETEEPRGWTPMFQLKVLVLSKCNIKMPEGSGVPRFLLHQHSLKKLDMSHNSLKGQFPDWLIKNNTKVEVVILTNNSFDSISFKSFYRNPSTRWMDMSENHLRGVIPANIQKYVPYINFLNLSRNSLEGSIPSSLGDLNELEVLDLSHNQLSGEVPTTIFTNLSRLTTLILSNNSLHGEVLSGYLNMSKIESLCLDSNSFTGNIGNKSTFSELTRLDISNNLFTGVIPSWISNMSTLSELVVRNNSLEGQFPCGDAPFLFLDVSQNFFSGVIPSCLNFQSLEHLHMGSNKFAGPIPNSFRGLTNVLTLDIGNNYLSSSIPAFFGELSNLRILLLRKNNFNGSIPKELCRLTNASLIDLSSNSISGSIPSCLQNISGPIYEAFTQTSKDIGENDLSYRYLSYNSDFVTKSEFGGESEQVDIPDEVLFTTKTLSLTYKGGALNSMSGLDISCNKLTGDIPEELGLLTRIHVLNLSHNRLTGPIPAKFSNLANIESLDLSFNRLTGEIPSELVKLNSLAVFNVSFNNLSGRLPEMKAQFGTFGKESYEGNPLLCGLPLENKCLRESQGTHPSYEKGSDEKWYEMDMVFFFGSFGSTWFVFVLGFAAVLYINPGWRMLWLNMIEEFMYTCYYFLYDSARNVYILFRK